MKKMASWVVGAGVTALALSGYAAASAAGVEPTAASADDSLTPTDVELAAIPSSEFASAVGPVLESFPSDYAFFYFDSDMQPVIGLTSEAVPAVMEAVTMTGQQAQVVEDTGFTQAEYSAAADKVIADLQETWPADVPFPMIGVRPDLGVGAIGANLITNGESLDAARSIQKSTGLIEEADTESPFSIQIDEENVFGPLKAATSIDR
ncbi:hypothetical protein [Cryobacterium zongtaii]|uniref:hypothetical protein n=1 Tax=Cryobacterium zongtaii TaxID=1259217 RepID=UPI001057045D|nr:hypothetical protein [Cryobacterium zongtaii]